MTLESRKEVAEFKHTFEVPNKDFTERTEKELKVKLIKDAVSYAKHMRSTRVGTHHSESIYFEVTIPKYLKDFLIDKLPDYDRFKKDVVFGDKFNKNFISKVRNATLLSIENFFNAMTNDALFIKELEKLEKLNKVIFIKSSSMDIDKRDNYNFADLNKLVGVDFHYFVCFEKQGRVLVTGEKSNEYYGLNRKGTSIGISMRNDNTRNKLPYIHCTDLSRFTKVKWTQEREDFLEKIQMRILDISSKIDEYVTKLDDKNFELVMKNQILLEKKEQ